MPSAPVMMRIGSKAWARGYVPAVPITASVDHLVTEMIEAGTHRRSDHGTAASESERIGPRTRLAILRNELYALIEDRCFGNARSTSGRGLALNDQNSSSGVAWRLRRPATKAWNSFWRSQWFVVGSILTTVPTALP